MKKYLIGSALLLSTSFSAIAQTEEEQIRQTIEAETAAFVNLSFAQVAERYWIMDDRTILNVTGPDGDCLQVDRLAIESRTEVPPPDHAQALKTNFQYLIRGNMAFVTCDQTVSFPDSTFKLLSHEFRVMEKVNGQWRIHQMSVHHYAQ